MRLSKWLQRWITVAGVTMFFLLCMHEAHGQQLVSISSSPGYQTVQDEGTGVTRRRTMNFTGAGVTCVDNAGANRTDCTIAGGAGGPAPSLLLYNDVPSLPAAADNAGALAYVMYDNSYYVSDGASWLRVFFAGTSGSHSSSTTDTQTFGVAASAGNPTTTLTIPADVAVGQTMLVARTDLNANTLIVQPSSGTIDGAASVSLANGEARIFVSDGGSAFLTAMSGRVDGLALGLRETSGPTNLPMGAVADGEYLRRSGSSIVGGTPVTGAPSTATYITQTPDAGLSNEQALSALATGILKSTTGTGVISIAAAGTDYQAAGTYLSTTQDEGTPLTQRATINFTGSSVSCTDDAGNSRTNCAITGGGLSLQETQIVTIYGGL